MKKRLAILNHPDTGAAESMAVMMRAIGWECAFPSEEVKDELRRIGCDTVCDIKSLVDHWGYEPPFQMPIATMDDMRGMHSVFMDVKAHRNGDKIVGRWPNLERRICWHRVNGSPPEIVPGKGDEINPQCGGHLLPILTPNMCYAKPGPWSDRSYTYWPPFYRFHEYYPKHGRKGDAWVNPVCFVHSVLNWGYGIMVPSAREMGVKCYGVRSPDGLVPHTQIPKLLSETLCMVHLKSNDAPGYAIYEACAAACPTILTWQLINRCNMHDLFEPDETCLLFEGLNSLERGPIDVKDCTRQLQAALSFLQDSVENERIGKNARNRLQEIMWSPDNATHVSSLKEFMGRFP